MKTQNKMTFKKEIKATTEVFLSTVWAQHVDESKAGRAQNKIGQSLFGNGQVTQKWMFDDLELLLVNLNGASPQTDADESCLRCRGGPAQSHGSATEYVQRSIHRGEIHVSLPQTPFGKERLIYTKHTLRFFLPPQLCSLLLLSSGVQEMTIQTAGEAARKCKSYQGICLWDSLKNLCRTRGDWVRGVCVCVCWSKTWMDAQPWTRSFTDQTAETAGL